MLEKLKPIKTTPTGIYFRMADGRIGYANHQYARVSVTREGIRNGQYYKEDSEIGDRLYQINSREEINREYDYDGVKKTISGVARIKYNDISEAINALQNFNNKNCGEYAVELRKNKILKQYEEHKALNIKSYLTKERVKEADTYVEGYNEGYNEGFTEGVASIEDKLVKLLNNL
jgi:hypothetical protein|tara:strand:- start:263 stop:787 length:525 start_codon:yes stop_codon:yes gene_type:complete